MSNNNYKPLKNSYGRTFIIEGRSRADHAPDYASQLKMTGITQPFGESTKIEIPDPEEYGKFIEVDEVSGASERATTSLVGRYAANIKSILLRLAKRKVSFDLQFHIGESSDPSAFNVFSKAIVLEDVKISEWSTEDMSALASDEQAKVDETVNISVKDIYEVVPLTFSSKANDVVINQLIDVCIFETPSDDSDGCNDIFALSKAGGGSPSTMADVVFSLDGGATFSAHDVDTLSAAEEPNAIAGVGDYVVVVSNATLSLHYALKSEFESGTDPAFTEIATGLVTSKGPNDIWSLGRKAFICGDGGYVYYTDDPTAGVEVLDAGSATVDNLNAIHAYDEENAVAVGDAGTVIFTTNKTNWTTTTTQPVGDTVDLTCVWMKNEDEWWVGASNGKLFYTLNAGTTWTVKALPGSSPTSIKAIAFATNSIGYVSGVVAGKGRIWRTFDGGYSWTITPEGSASLVACDEVTALAACKYDANFVVGAGLADNASDGILLIGEG